VISGFCVRVGLVGFRSGFVALSSGIDDFFGFFLPVVEGVMGFTCADCYSAGKLNS
jgi:hypothetical protein